MDESSFGPRLENVSFHELRRREMKFQFSLVFFIGAPSSRFHISKLQISKREIHEHKKERINRNH